MIRRAPRPAGNFTVIRNEVLRDTRLSYRSRGVLAAILSRPDNWRTSALQLSREGAEGRDAVLTALNELETFGYLARGKYALMMGLWIGNRSSMTHQPRQDYQALVLRTRILRRLYNN